MASARARNTVIIWTCVVAALAATIAVSYLLVVVVPAGLVPATAAPPVASDAGLIPSQPGVHLTLTAGDVTVERPLPAPAFSLQPGEVLDPRLPAGPFRGTMHVTFDPAAARRARLGAEIDGVAVIIERRGDVIASGEGPGVVRSDLMYMPGRLVTYTYRFRAGDGPVRMRAVWRPEDAQVDLPIPCDGAAGGVLARAADRGLGLIQQLHCTACHVSDIDPLKARPAPVLADIGGRARPDWMRQWLAGPHALRPGSSMPALFDPSDPDDRETIEDLVHFLSSQGGPFREGAAPDPDLVATGRVIYRSVGCAACHGSLETETSTDFVSHGALAEKTTVAELAAFLRDPLALRPAGRMPSLNLSELEATAIASYLVQHDLESRGSIAPEAFAIDAVRTARGREAFTSRGCAACHTLGEPALVSTLAAPPLQSASPEAGCLAPAPPQGVPDYALTAAQRRDLAEALAELSEWRTTEAPQLWAAATIQRLDCVACHRWHGFGGPVPSVDPLFTTLEEADLGDEGRLPPDLSSVAARLQPAWLRAVLEDAGAARPYMSARMPQFGVDNVADLPAHLLACTGAPPTPVEVPPPADNSVEIGRQLVGVKGFNCIQCHSIAGRASTGLPGPDLVQMAERLRYRWFNDWLHDPRLLHPGTRMPTFFYGGRSGLPQCDGNAQQQIDAMWAYLGLGEFLPLPEGLSDPGDFQIAVEDEPVVLRTFMEGVGPRAIACGFPEAVHFVFDAERCRLAHAWTGRFLNAATIWAARGGHNTDPEQGFAWSAPAVPLLAGADGTPLEPRFRGYRLDTDRVPTFEYELHGSGQTFTVRERAQPLSGSGLSRFVQIEGPPGASLRLYGDRLVQLDDAGRLRLDLEVTW